MTETHFDGIADLYDETLPAHVTGHYLEKRTRFILDHCPGGRALDVGCGTGALALRLERVGYEMVGVDPSEGMLRVMREHAPGVEAVLGSGTELPFEEGEFDLALSVAAMHHIADPEAVRRALGEMARVTRPGGRVLIWDHNPRNPYWPLLMKRVPQDSGEERLIPVEELLAGLRSGGAEPVLVRQLGLVPDFTPPRLLGAAAWLERTAERTPLLRARCAHNVVLAEKR
jgi:ubiquinone/menaquinone biosynthesis C-methylase UbiE